MKKNFTKRLKNDISTGVYSVAILAISSPFVLTY
jgi:hypothetical protein